MPITTYVSKPDNLAMLAGVVSEALQLARSNACGLTLFVPFLSRVRGYPLAQVTGHALIETLLENRVCTSGSITIRLEASSTLAPREECGVILALWPNPFMQDRLLACKEAREIRVLMTSRGDLDRWLSLSKSTCVESLPSVAGATGAHAPFLSAA